MVGDLAHGAWVCVHLFTCARVVEEEGEEAKGESDADVCTYEAVGWDASGVEVEG